MKLQRFKQSIYQHRFLEIKGDSTLAKKEWKLHTLFLPKLDRPNFPVVVVMQQNAKSIQFGALLLCYLQMHRVPFKILKVIKNE